MIKQVKVRSQVSVPIHLEDNLEGYQECHCIAYGSVNLETLKIVVEQVLLDGLSKPVLGEWLDNHSYAYVASDLLNAAVK